MRKTIEIRYRKKLLAIIIPKEFKKKGIEFFTPAKFSQQLAYMCRPAGYQIPAHIHKIVKREVYLTQEVLFVKSGKIRVDFFTRTRKLVKSCIIKSGDVLLLVNGGHAFTMIEPSELVEVKQGPYVGEDDKVRFDLKENK